MQKLVKIADLSIAALINTGSEITVMREDFYRLRGYLALYHVRLQLPTFVTDDVIPIGSFDGTIHIDKHEFNTTTYVTNFSRETVSLSVEM